MTSKCSIKVQKLPDSPPPTKAAYQKPRIETEGKSIKLIPTSYKPMPTYVEKVKSLKLPKKKKKKTSYHSIYAHGVSSRQRWTDERLEALAVLYEEGKSYMQIADELNTTISMVNMMASKLRKTGRLTVSRCNNKGWTKEQDQKLIEAYEKGMTYSEISKVILRPPSTCCNRINQLIKDGEAKKRCVRSRRRRESHS